jgi:hypothetical protein
MIDIDEARKLVHALDADLDGLSDGSADLQKLRNEVEALRGVLQAPDPGHGWVREALEDIRSSIQHGADTARIDAIVAGRYIAALGKMLGL